MENYNEIVKRLALIIEQSDVESPACRNCVTYKNGGCSYGCLNERVRITSPNYSCQNFHARYTLNEETLDSIRDLMDDIKRIMRVLPTLTFFLQERSQNPTLMIL